ncbi:hypothetical protein NLJ89_g6274 [Agrocybe chaxingu]|uniref:CBM1 domain-containing protein n=1 Tax=Agrocybe chaxingu TaxID=84603 RepID=A0A9W8K6R0_9AGAR|nr:hypothetical protein NLJ89_g6274 [Agrocybe chaxingu]
MSKLLALVSFVLLAKQATAQQQQVWGQCGGIGWTGPTSCVSGTTCVQLNDWYFQCQPGSAPTTAAPPPLPSSLSPILRLRHSSPSSWQRGAAASSLPSG